MRHLESKPLVNGRLQPAPAKKGASFSRFAVGLAVIALVGGLGFTQLFPPSVPDRVSQSETLDRIEAFAKLGALVVPVVEKEKVTQALPAMGLSPSEAAALSNSLAQPAEKKTGLVELSLWDTHAPDGDVVRITSAGYSREVLLSKTPMLVYVPGSGSGVIQITGMQDGGGGITLAVKGAQQSILMPIMSVGQTISLPVSFQ